MRAGAILGVLLAFAGSAWADFQAGLQAWEKADFRTAFDQFKPDAEAGDAKAQFYLGEAFSLGRGTVQDYAEALKWYRKAADQGLASAQNSLGVMYYNGQGVPQDYVQAHMWFNLAAAHFPASGVENRDKAVENRDRAASLMTPADISKAQQLAREWLAKHPQ